MKKRQKPKGNRMRLVPQSCPDCGGVLQLAEEGSMRFPIYCCQVGHRYSISSLLSSKETQLEGGLWSAVVLLKQMGDAYEQLVKDMSQTDGDRKAIQRRIKEVRRQNFTIRKIIEDTHVA